MEATGNGGLDLADFLHGEGVRVSVVNPARVKAYGESELVRNKTDRLPTPASPARRGPQGCGADRPLLPCPRAARLGITRLTSARLARAGSPLRRPQGHPRPRA